MSGEMTACFAWRETVHRWRPNYAIVGSVLLLNGWIQHVAFSRPGWPAQRIPP